VRGCVRLERAEDRCRLKEHVWITPDSEGNSGLENRGWIVPEERRGYHGARKGRGWKVRPVLRPGRVD